MTSVYVVTHIESGRKYVGFTSLSPSLRFRQHINDSRGPHRCRYFHNTLAKYGPLAFNLEIYGTYASIEAGLNAECELIWLIRDMGAPSFNLTSGGEHYRHSEESKESVVSLI